MALLSELCKKHEIRKKDCIRRRARNELRIFFNRDDIDESHSAPSTIHMLLVARRILPLFASLAFLRSPSSVLTYYSAFSLSLPLKLPSCLLRSFLF